MTTVVALVTALVLCSAGQAAVGYGTPATASCYTGNRIIVTPPKLSPEFPAGSGGYLGNGVVSNNPSQDVAYRAHIYLWNGSQWVYLISGPWFRQTVTSNPNGLGGSGWVNLSTGRLEQGQTIFSPYVRGYFRVAAEYHWYPVAGSTSYSGGSLPRTWVDHYDYRKNAYSLLAEPWCLY